MYDGWKIFAISFIIALIVSTAVSGLFFFIFVPYWEGRSKSVDVPKVTDLTLTEASSILTSRNLLVSVEEAEDLSIPKGRVISQNPPAGSKVKKGDVVRLKVSSGMPTVEVPSLAGVSLKEAIELLNLKGLHLGKTKHQPSQSFPANFVISSSPPSGARVAKGSSVDLVVSTEIEKVKVPRLYGKSLERAKAILESQNLKLGNVSWITSEEHQFDIVISQSPKPGTMVPKGSSVDITINREAY